MHVKNFHKRHRYLYLASVLCCFLPYWPILLYWSRDPEKHYHRLVRARRQIARASSFLAGFSYQIRYRQEIDWSRPYIICPNHTSNLDITAMVLACPTDFSFVGKDELLHNPVTGLFFRTIDIPVNRSSRISSFKAFKRAADLLDKGRSVLIFPEGKIGNDYPPILCEFKNGPFRMALEKQIPIIPVVIDNAWKRHWDNGKAHGSYPGPIRVDVLAPIETTGMPVEETEALKEQVYQLIDRHWLRDHRVDQKKQNCL